MVRRMAVVLLGAALAVGAACSPSTEALDAAGAGTTTEATSGAGTVPPGTAAAAGTTTPTTAPTTTTVPTAPATGVLRTPTGVLVPLRGQRLDGSGWVVGTPCGREAVVGWGTLVPSVRVVIDPGHGGAESGSISPRNRWESDLNLDVALRVEQLLLAQGVSVALTRREDVQVALPARAELARAFAPELVVSVHHNGGQIRTGTEPGTIVFHQVDAPSSRRLAGLLHEEVVAAFRPLELRFGAATPPGAYAVRNTEGEDYYSLLRNTAGVPTVIVEALFLTNPTEAEALERDEVRQTEAQAIADGILRYLTTTQSGSGFRPEMQFGPGSMPDSEPAVCTDPTLG